MRFFLDILAGFDCIFKRIGFSRVLLSFYNIPAIEVTLVHIVEDGFKVDIAISGHSEHAGADAVQEAHLLIDDPLADRQAHILQMDVADITFIINEFPCSCILGRSPFTTTPFTVCGFRQCYFRKDVARDCCQI